MANMTTNALFLLRSAPRQRALMRPCATRLMWVSRYDLWYKVLPKKSDGLFFEDAVEAKNSTRCSCHHKIEFECFRTKKSSGVRDLVQNQQ